MSLMQNITRIRQLIRHAEITHHRKPDSVLLLAVSKQQNIQAITEAYQLGIMHFAENYYQEALYKIEALNELPLCWHFIGSIQTNKTKGIALHFDWVHSLDCIQKASLLNQYRPSYLPPLKVCLQINLLEEKSKSGILPQQSQQLAQTISQLPHLQLKGLMLIPPIQKNPQEQYQIFLQLHELLLSLNRELGLSMDTLSMGMSEDYITAIEAGATIVRIGKAIFGERTSIMNEIGL